MKAMKAPAVAEPKAMKAMKVMKKKAAMKAMKAVMKKKATTMTKGGICESLASETEVGKSDCSKLLDSLAALGAKEVKKTGKFTLPGLVMIKTRVRPATKAGKREIFGKVVNVKAMKARTVVKAFAVKVLKDSV